MEIDVALHCSIAYRENINASYIFYGKPVQVTDKAEQLILIAIVSGTSLIISYYTILYNYTTQQWGNITNTKTQ